MTAPQFPLSLLLESLAQLVGKSLVPVGQLPQRRVFPHGSGSELAHVVDGEESEAQRQEEAQSDLDHSDPACDIT